jgi:hypothetical protein
MEAVDIFHDTRYEPAGYPDGTGDTSLVQHVNRSLTIRPPAEAVSTKSKWDCHVWTSPLSVSAATPALIGKRNGQVINSTASDPTAFYGSLGTINYKGVLAGVPTLPGGQSGTVPPTPDASQSSGCISAVTQATGASGEKVNDHAYLDGDARIVAQGYEIVDSTPWVKRGGTVACYRMNQAVDESFTVTTPEPINEPGTHTALRIGMTKIGTLPPADISEVFIQGEVVEWEAPQGVYCNMTQPHGRCKFTRPTPSSLYLEGGKNPPLGAISGSDNNAQGLSLQPTYDNSQVGYEITAGSAVSFVSQDTVYNEFDVSGQYFRNLSPEASLEINYRCIIERRPTVQDGDLIVLARPQAMEDPLAWALYVEARNQMPAAVPLDENALGEWFRNVVSTVTKQALPFMGRQLLPAATGLATGGYKGAAAAVGANILDEIFDEKKERKKMKKKMKKEEAKLGREVLRKRSKKISKKVKISMRR